MPRNQAVAAKEAPEQTQARNRPTRSTRNDVEVDGAHVSKQKPRDLKSTGPAREALEPSEVVVADERALGDKAAMLAFMEEELTVVVHETTDVTDDPIPQVTNDGVNQFFIRGKEQKVKRKFVEVLARAKKTTYTQQLAKDSAGNEFYRNVPHTVPRYPFTVMHDPNPRGRAWLQALREQPN